MQTWAILDGIDDRCEAHFDHVVNFEGTHPQRLNELARQVSLVAKESDDILFLDGDAFPIRPFDELLCSAGDGPPLIAVRRDENLGDPQPHPCFCLTTVGFWNRIGGDWRVGYRWRNSAGDDVTDVGGNLMEILQTHAVAWRPLTRRNTADLHPLWFGVYGDAAIGDVVYHHGAGFRPRIARVDGTATELSSPVDRVPVVGPWLARRRRAHLLAEREAWEATEGVRQVELAASVFEGLRTDPQFYRRFTGVSA